MDYYVLVAVGVENVDANSNDNLLLSKSQNNMFLLSLYQKGQSKVIETFQHRIWQISVLKWK